MTTLNKYELQRMIGEEDDKRIQIHLYKKAYKEVIIKNTYNVYCPKCKSDNVHVEQKQIRSADEGATNFYECLDCHHKWHRNN